MRTLAIYQSREQKSNISKINTPLGYAKKTRKEINRENYLKNAEERKERARSLRLCGCENWQRT